jgi:ABC-type branched-subunit amino acid transport system substrate-binding protein/serine/threonine protein kinase
MYNSNSLLEVYCTRPSCQYPINRIPEERLSTRPVRQLHCNNCGMPLILEGRFLPLRLLVPDEERGGFGRTFTAWDLNFEEQHLRVIKQLHPKSTPPESQLEVIERMFKREAKVLERLRHPQIPRSLAFFPVDTSPDLQNQFAKGANHQQKFFYLVQDYIEGQNLAQKLREKKQFSENEVLMILQQLLEILKYVHNEGVIHRDIKPSNIMRCETDGRLYLIDFGAVKQVVVTGIPTEQSTVFPATPDYAPPEQVAGRAVSFSSDLYSLTVTCICLLTGKHPKQLRREDRWIWRQYANVSDNFAGILDRMLLAEPEQRFQSAEQVIAALSEQPLSEQPTVIEKPNRNTSPLPPPSGNQPTRNQQRLINWYIVGSVLLGLAIALASPKIWSIIFPRFQEELQLSANDFTRGEEPLLNENIELSSTACKPAFDKKRDGMQAFGAQKFSVAKENFQAAINQFARLRCSVDPETLIFLNNTKANIQGNPPITIAVVVPINGSDEFSKLAKDVLRGVAHVQENLNNQSNGIEGRLLQVMIVRDDNDPDKAKRVAMHLASHNIPGDRNFNANILGVIGHFTSDVTLIAGDVYESKKIVAVSPTSTAVRQSNSNSSDYKFNLSNYVFRTATTDSVAADDLFEYVQTNLDSGKGAILFYSKQIYSQSLKEAFEKKFASGEIVSCDLFKHSVDYCVEQTKSAKFRMLDFGVGRAADVLLAIERNQSQLPLLGGDALYNDDKLSTGFGKKTENMVLAVPTHVEITTPSFKEESIKLWGTQFVGWRTITAYDAAQVIVEGLKKQGNNPSPQGLYDVLNNPNFSTQGATGTVQFDAQHDRKVNPEDKNKLGVLVRVQRQCKSDDNNDKYKFCLLEQQ